MEIVEALIETPTTNIKQRRLKEETEAVLLEIQQDLIMMIEGLGGDVSELEDTFGDLDINERYSSRRTSKL